jgi:hypothetical protein
VRQYRELMDRYQPQPPAGLLSEPYSPPPYSYISLEGFLNAKLLVKVLEKLGGDLDRSRIRRVVESLDEVDLEIDVPASFGPQRHQALNKVYCTSVVDGRFVPLSTEDWQRWRK